MMQACLLTFLSAKAPDDEDRPGNNLAQLEAGTGTGKTVAYCLAAIVASEALKKTVIVSTATVALQEQLFQKDLPRLAEIIPELQYEILKGRARYVCESRLEGVINDEVQDSLLTGEFQDAFADARWQAKGIPRDRAEAMLWFKNTAKKLHSGSWDGDIDSLAQPPEPEDWRQVQANAHACNGGQCEYFRSCAFFKARRQAASATLQVANHALILATLQTDSTLIDPGNTLFVFDEAHHLPNIAADQFSYRAPGHQRQAAHQPAHRGASPWARAACIHPAGPGSLCPTHHRMH
ncbi:Rad3-related DNA helicase-like protein [Polaromonas sp. P1(28)-13]|nr:Rad3-related DNA helicase-like protein [Polaromonas sp. P1(28)-13]